MQLEFTPEERAFRAEVRTFIAENYPADVRAKQDQGLELGKEDFLTWHRIVAKQGWSVPAWPVEYGGTGWTATQRYIWAEELRVPTRRRSSRSRDGRSRHLHLRHAGAEGTVPAAHPLGRRLVVPGLFRAGRRLRPRLAEDAAVRDGDHYIVNGQKTWTTLAQYADWGFFLVRTDPSARKQEGICFLLIDMKTPGVTVRPIITLDGAHEVNEVFLENVKVPVENRVYEENKGWTCAKFLLAHERSGIAGVARSKRAGQAAQARSRRSATPGSRLLDDPIFRRKLDELEIDLTALEFTELRTLAAESAGKAPGVEVSMLKIKGTEIQQRLTELTLEALGSHAYGCASAAPRHSVGDTTQLPVPGAHRRRRHVLQPAQAVDLRRLERDPAQHHREDGAGALNAPQRHQTPRLPERTWISTSPKNRRAARQRGALSSANDYASTQRQAVIRSEDGLAARLSGAASPRLGILGAPFAKTMGGLGGGAIETMIIMEEIRQGAGHRALSRHRGARRRLPAPLRSRRRQRTDRRHHRRRASASPSPSPSREAASISPTSTSAAKEGGTARRCQRPQGRRSSARRSPTTCSSLRASRGAGSATSRASRSSSSTKDAPGRVVARLPDGRRLARLGSQVRERRVGADACSARQGSGLRRWSKRRSTKASRRSAPKASASMRRLLNATTVEYCQDAQAVRRADRANSRCCSTAWSTCSWSYEQSISMTYMATLKLDRPALERKQGGVGRQGADRQGRTLRRPERRPVARRHGHDRRTHRRPLLQAPDDDRVRVRLRRSSRRAHRAV